MEKKTIVEIEETVENGRTVTEIYLGTDLTIRSDLEKIIEVLQEHFNENDEIRLTTQSDAEIDASFVQIIIAAQKLSKEKQIPLKMNIQLSPVSKELIEISGLNLITK